MSILFERRVESGDDLPTGHVRVTTGATDEAEMTHEAAMHVDDRVDLLEDEVDHLRACIDQLLDMVDAQLATGDHLELLSDRMALFERRMQRVEDGVSDLHRADKRRVGDH